MSEIMMRKRAGLLALFGMGIPMLVGCGGGGGSTTTGTDVSPSARLLAPQIGQTWSYKTTGTEWVESGTLNVAGTHTLTLAASDVSGATLEAVDSLNLATGSQTFSESNTWHLHVEDSGDESLVAIKDESSSPAYELDTPILYLPSTFTPTLNYANSTKTANPYVDYNTTFKVVGQERVTVPAGTFSTWKVESMTVFGTETIRSTRWYAPEIGDYVKATYTQTSDTYPSAALSLTDVLTSTSVSH